MSNLNESTLFTNTNTHSFKTFSPSVVGWQDRCVNEIDNSTLWEKLTLAQKFSANNLRKFGYKLDYIREKAGMAVLNCNGTLAVINHSGEIDTYPNIAIRASE